MRTYHFTRTAVLAVLIPELQPVKIRAEEPNVVIGRGGHGIRPAQSECNSGIGGCFANNSYSENENRTLSMRKTRIGDELKQTSIRPQRKFKMAALDDGDISEWLMRLTEVRSGRFLCAFSEAVMEADGEDYANVRPALMNLKRKYSVPNPYLEDTYSAFAGRKGVT